jgi:hypothetical protein
VGVEEKSIVSSLIVIELPSAGAVIGGLAKRLCSVTMVSLGASYNGAGCGRLGSLTCTIGRFGLRDSERSALAG